jgi:hypothetical protein
LLIDTSKTIETVTSSEVSSLAKVFSHQSY